MQVDVASLLAPFDPDPSGPDLEYDPGFRELEQAAAGRPEQQVGDVVVSAQEPDWRDVRARAEAMLRRTKDLRVATLLARSLLRTAGFVGFADGLSLLRGLVENRWADMHPRLDPDDGNDPTMRVNVLLSLCDPTATLNAVRTTPLVISPSLGTLSLRDHAIASGELPPPADLPEDEKPTLARFEGAFQEAPLEQLTGNATAITTALASLKGLEEALGAQVGAGSAPSFEPLQRLLWQASKIVGPKADARSGTPSPDGTIAPVNGANGHAGPAHAGAALAGEVRSRQDVVRAIDKICDYYARHEPSSPVPVLLKRAKKLATMSFEDIIKNLVPDGMSQLNTIRGPEEETES